MLLPVTRRTACYPLLEKYSGVPSLSILGAAGDQVECGQQLDPRAGLLGLDPLHPAFPRLSEGTEVPSLAPPPQERARTQQASSEDTDAQKKPTARLPRGRGLPEAARYNRKTQLAASRPELPSTPGKMQSSTCGRFPDKIHNVSLLPLLLFKFTKSRRKPSADRKPGLIAEREGAAAG